MMKKPWPGPDKIVLALILLMFSASMALAEHQPRVCNLYEIFVGVIAERYGEQLIEARKADHGGRYEIWKSEETGTWTLIEIMPDNVKACILGSGVTDPHTPDELMQRNAYTGDFI